jgi:hypothetical protein
VAGRSSPSPAGTTYAFTSSLSFAAPRSAEVAGVASAGFAGHHPGAEVLQRLPAWVAAHGAVVGFQLVDFESWPDLPRFLRFVLHGGSVSTEELTTATRPAGSLLSVPWVASGVPTEFARGRQAKP